VNIVAYHGPDRRATSEGKNRQGWASSGKLSQFPLLGNTTRPVADAPTRALLTAKTPAECLDWMMRANGLKGAYVAACTGLSEGYISRLRKGVKPIDRENSLLIRKLCVATGSNLLEKFFAATADDDSLRADVAIAALRSVA
jgi:hypothetical protein